MFGCLFLAGLENLNVRTWGEGGGMEGKASTLSFLFCLYLKRKKNLAVSFRFSELFIRALLPINQKGRGVTCQTS